MGYFKIKNITNLLPKRHLAKDSMLEIEYTTGFKKESFKLNVGKEAYIEAGNLPINIHKLRIKNHISVVEISKNEFFKKQNPVVAVPIAKVEVKPEIIEDTEHKELKKKNSRKKEDSTVETE